MQSVAATPPAITPHAPIWGRSTSRRPRVRAAAAIAASEPRPASLSALDCALRACSGRLRAAASARLSLHRVPEPLLQPRAPSACRSRCRSAVARARGLRRRRWRREPRERASSTAGAGVPPACFDGAPARRSRTGSPTYYLAPLGRGARRRRCPGRRRAREEPWPQAGASRIPCSPRRSPIASR